MSAESERLASLTPRELAVLHAVATGRSNPGIAADLYISVRTVEAHLRSIFEKLELRELPDSNQRVHATLRWLGIHRRHHRPTTVSPSPPDRIEADRGRAAVSRRTSGRPARG
ncbi:response regulator transcription factor [Agrobacterium sp. S2]|nr:response regulator transcription factor [Agrobacterium sp. S2]